MKRTLFILLAAVLIPACGGGGGGGTLPVPPGFSGEYWALSFAREAVAHRGATGILTSDGAGNLVGTTTDNVDGVVSTGNVESSMYSLVQDGTLIVTRASGSVLTGGCNPGRDVAVMAATSPGSDPTIVFLTRKSGSYSNASLNGDYFLVTYLFDFASATHVSLTGEVAFDGAGSALGGTVTANAEGLATPGTVFGGGPYLVGADGTFVQDPGGSGIAGGLSKGGEVAVLGGMTASGENPYFSVMLRKPGVVMNDSSLQGDYFFMAIGRDPAADEHFCVSGSFTFDGLGGYGIASTLNTDGAISGPFGATGPYSVGADGSVLITAGTDTLEGGVLADGSAFALASTTTGNDPMIVIGIRKTVP